MKNSHFFTFLAVILLLVIPISIFIHNFFNQDISDKISDWSDFGGYISAFVALCNLIIFIIISFQLQLYNEKESQHTKDLQKPILSFRKDSSNSIIENVGAGTALNIFVKYNYDISNSFFYHSYQCYNLRSGSTAELIWPNETNIIVAEYNDIFGNKYFSYFENNILQFFSEIDGQKNYTREYKRAKSRILEVKVVET